MATSQVKKCLLSRRTERKEATLSNRVLVVGVPRSGTTWVATILSKCRDTMFVNEPDDERRNTHAEMAKASLGRYPIIAPHDRLRVGNNSIVEYQELWKWAFAHPMYKNVVVKSVFVPYCLEWVRELCQVDHILYVRRNPMNILASWYEYSSKVNENVPTDELCRRLAWQYSMQHMAYDRVRDEMHTVDHEQIAVNWGLFESLAVMLGLEWTHEAAEQLNDLSHEGEGGHPGLENYKLEEHISRSQEQLRVDSWKSRISDEVRDYFLDELSRWGLVGVWGL